MTDKDKILHLVKVVQDLVEIVDSINIKVSENAAAVRKLETVNHDIALKCYLDQANIVNHGIL